jgi:hypothetical protein
MRGVDITPSAGPAVVRALRVSAFQRVNGSFEFKFKRNDQIKKSLQALIRTENPLLVSYFTDENFAGLIRMIENREAGSPLGDGVESRLRGIHGRPAYVKPLFLFPWVMSRGCPEPPERGRG